MAYTTGRCINDLYCAAASGRQLLQIPVGSQFVCPQCGKPLAEPSVEKRGIRSPAMLACCGLVAAGGALFAIGALIGDRPPAARRDDPALASVEAPVAPAHMEDAAGASATPAPVPPADAAPAQKSKDSAVPQGQIAKPDDSGVVGFAAPSAKVSLAMMQQPAREDTRPAQVPAPALVQMPPVPAVPNLSQAPSPAPAPVQIQSRAQELAQAQGRARAAVANQARTAELARRAKAAQFAAEQQKMLARQAEDQRRKAEVQQIEATAEQAARQRLAVAQSQQAALEARQRQVAEARTAAGAASLPKGPTRGFSPKVLSGGAPGYPADLESEGRTGRVTVSCLITQGGTPHGCHVMSSQGGLAFDRSVLGWLGSGQVRFAPILRDGAPQAEEHSWSLNFEP